MVLGTRDSPSPEANLSSVSWVFLGHSITVGFAELIFTSLIRISALNPKSPCRELSRLGESKRNLYEEKLSHMPGLPYLPR